MKSKLILFIFMLLLSPLMSAKELSYSEALQLAQDHSFELKKAAMEREAYNFIVQTARGRGSVDGIYFLRWRSIVRSNSSRRMGLGMKP